MNDPIHQESLWVPALVVIGTHFEQLQEHGGTHGQREGGLLDAALARPRNKYHHAPDSDVAELAAAYAFAIAKTSHPFVDGNKRSAFVTAAIFLGLNGHRVEATDDDVVNTMNSVADRSLSEEQLAEWFRERLRAA